MAAPAKLWDTEWAAEKAAEALRYLGRNYPEGLQNPRVLDPHEEAAHEGVNHASPRPAPFLGVKLCQVVGPFLGVNL